MFRNVLLATVLLVCLGASRASAQFSAEWYTIDSGGIEAAAGPWALDGSVGQHDPIVSASGDGWEMYGGFWTPPLSCNTDYDENGVGDQDDVVYLINVIAGGDNPTGRDPDFDCSGIADQDDVIALIGVIAGGECPPC